MMLTREVREALARLLNAQGSFLSSNELEQVKALSTRLARFDDLPIDEVIRMLDSIRPEGSQVSQIVATLRAVLLDDKAFANTFQAFAAQRKVTKAILIAVYKSLYDRQGGIRASAPREEVVQLIIDERNVLKRHGTLERLATTNAAAA